VSFNGTSLGYVAYRIGGRPVSLAIEPIWAATLAGRRQVRMKSLTIHYDLAGGFHIVTWAVPRKGVTYALVSDARQHANQSCIICHAGPNDRAFMRSLLNLYDLDARVNAIDCTGMQGTLLLVLVVTHKPGSANLLSKHRFRYPPLGRMSFNQKETVHMKCQNSKTNRVLV